MRGLRMNKQDIFVHVPAVPYEGDCSHFLGLYGGVVPFEYTGWRDETLAWKNSAYLGTALNNSPTYKIKGPDVTRGFLLICFVITMRGGRNARPPMAPFPLLY